jgi:hypothetical protein
MDFKIVAVFWKMPTDEIAGRPLGWRSSLPARIKRSKRAACVNETVAPDTGRFDGDSRRTAATNWHSQPRSAVLPASYSRICQLMRVIAG